MEVTDWYKPKSGANFVQWFQGSTARDDYDNIGTSAKIETKGVPNSSVSLNSDGSATNDQTGEATTSSVSGQTSIVTKTHSESDLDPSTVGQNYFGGTFSGGNNPRDFGGRETFKYTPDKPFDPAAIGHDKRFDNLGAAGAASLFTDTRTIGADWLFVAQELKVSLRNDISNDDRTKAYMIGTGLGFASSWKTIYRLNNPAVGLSSILLWFQISNKGVTNNPSK